MQKVQLHSCILMLLWLGVAIQINLAYPDIDNDVLPPLKIPIQKTPYRMGQALSEMTIVSVAKQLTPFTQAAVSGMQVMITITKLIWSYILHS